MNKNKILTAVVMLAAFSASARTLPTTVAESEAFLNAEVEVMQRHGVATSWQPVGVCMVYAKPFEAVGRALFKRGIGTVVNGNQQTEAQAAFNAANAAYGRCLTLMYTRGLMPQMLDIDYPRLQEDA